MSSETATKHVWTELAIHYDATDQDRPFRAVVHGKVRDRSQGMVPRQRVHRTGTLAAAVAWFDASALRDKLWEALPPDVDSRFPDVDGIRRIAADQRRAERGYQGEQRLGEALAWLYPESAGWSRNELALRVEADFAVGRRNVVNALNGEDEGKRPVSWIAAFVTALRFVDRKLFRIAHDLPAVASLETA